MYGIIVILWYVIEEEDQGFLMHHPTGNKTPPVYKK